MNRFVEKIVIVTGASSGIGKGTAELFAKYGSTLVITGRNAQNLEEAAENCKQNGAKDVLPIIADFKNMSEVDKTVDEAVKKFSKIDVLVNNAGAMKRGHLESVQMEDFDWMFNVNIKSMLRLTQKAMPHLVATKGCVVNVSGVTSQYAFPHLLVYSMTKAAVDQFTKNIALEYAPKGVRVNAVNPASVKTNIGRKRALTTEEMEKVYSTAATFHPLGRIGTAEEMARAIFFLASENSAWTTGQCLLIDGGKSLTIAQ